ncbi:MAG: hypothetical protein ICV63_13990 [Coleofasciculus sp. Co-bin14]|nr:hypothetical protein [Coleofasciculus sp. Co-bin14]
MSEKIKRQVQRHWDEAERNRHGQQVRERFANQREKKVALAQDVIEEMLDQGVTISQNEVARRTGFSVGFVNKHLAYEIEKAKQKQEDSARKSRTVRQLSAEGKELERLRLLNRRLQGQLEEQRRAKKELRAQVARVVDLEDEVNRLRTQSRELWAKIQASQEKVVNLPVQNMSVQIEAALKQTGIQLNSTLRHEIPRHTPEAALQAIKAFEQYRSTHAVDNPAACLMKALKEEWKPNIADEQSITPEKHEFEEQPKQKKLIEKLEAENLELRNLLKEIGGLSEAELIEKISAQQRDIKRLNTKNRELQAKSLGIESLEVENEELKKHKQHLFNRVTELEASERSQEKKNFAEAKKQATKQPEIPDVDY